MIHIKSFNFNPFQENMYILHDETSECIIIDPGCFTKVEQEKLVNYIKENKLKPVKLFNTHCHIDHILGNAFIAETYNLELEICEKEIPILNLGEASANRYNIPYNKSPNPTKFWSENDILTFGNSSFHIWETPGHSPGSISLIHSDYSFAIVGDVLFYRSIGRTDLPMGNHEQLIDSIKSKLLNLPDECVIFSGHGQSTTIGFEQLNNPFLQ